MSEDPDYHSHHSYNLRTNYGIVKWPRQLQYHQLCLPDMVALISGHRVLVQRAEVPAAYAVTTTALPQVL